MRKLILFVVIVLGLYLLWRWWTSPPNGVADRGQKLFYDRLWVDHLPRDERDEMQLFAAITDEPLGLFQKASTWRASYELFRYEPAGDGKATLLYPQTRDKERVSYRAAPCDAKGFDFCLEISGNSRGVRRYYSQRGWELKHAGPLQARLGPALHAIEAGLE